MKRLLALVLCLCFVLDGCAQSGMAVSGSYRKFALGLAVSPEPSDKPDECVDTVLMRTFTQYTGRMTRQITAGETEKNVAYSPANLYLALCMLAETTDGESRAQILDLLGLGGIERTRTTANALWRDLYRNDETGKTLLANSIWLNEQYGFHQDTVDTLVNDYYASTFRVPMGDPATDAAMQEWINENTNRLLNDAANELKTNGNDLVWLVSTLYFKGTWQNKFKVSDTRKDTFTAANGAEQQIDFMHGAWSGTYYRGENYTAAALSFRDGTSMWFLLPDEGTAPAPDALLQLAAGNRQNVTSDYVEIRWSVPKFEVDSKLDLILALQALGVTDIFDESVADFSPLLNGQASVGKAEHAVRVTVDEEGCEAAAYTASNRDVKSLPPVVEMNLNRPFTFLITGADGLPLFVGVVNTME